MKKTLLLIIIACCFMQGKAGAQNLVPNPSFEEYDTCPFAISQIRYALNWYNYGSQTPEYYNSCSTNNCSTPSNFAGYQIPYQGMAYAGIYSYWFFNPNYREYMTAQLISPLVINQKYFVSFKLCLANTAITGGTNKIGALLSSQPYYFISTNPTFKNFAHVYCNNVITDSVNWTDISGSFVADSTYSYLSLGNFYDTSNFNRFSFNNNPCNAYYYIDMVCVSTDSLTCNPPVSIKEITTNNSISIFPNPATTSINISFSGDNIKTITYTLSDILGRKIKQGALGSGGAIDVSGCSKGVYVLRLGSGEAEVCRKVVVQ